MINVGFSLSSVVGLVLILGALAYFFVSITQIVNLRSEQADSAISRILQLIFAPIILFLSGIILLFQGWRQDPLLLFKDILMTVLIGYLIFLDINKMNRTSSQ